jgi:Tfp pilus assembly protein PilF
LEAEEAGRRSYRESKWAAAKGAIEKREEIEKRKEADLQGKLRLAKRFLDTDPAVAKRRLQELVKQYPDTDEAKEATKLLRKLEEDAK